MEIFIVKVLEKDDNNNTEMQTTQERIKKSQLVRIMEKEELN